MRTLRHILHICLLMLFAALSTHIATAAPQLRASDITYTPTEIIHASHAKDLTVTARAPPIATTNVAITGGVTSKQGSGFALHSQETLAAFFEFGSDLNATNRTVDPTEVSFSQATVSSHTTDGLTIDELAESMRQNGWQGRPLDVVTRDGAPTSLDNRRLLAARRAGIEVPVTVRNANDPLPAERVSDFTVTGQPAPTTWGEAMDLRIGRQGEIRGAPSDWADRFPNGSIYDPVIVE